MSWIEVSLNFFFILDWDTILS